MGVVDAETFRGFLSMPEWRPGMETVAQLVLDGVEATLAGALQDTLITPEPFEESALVIARTGLVATSYPVSQVLALDGVQVVDDALPSGWRVQRHCLYRSGSGGGGTVGVGSLWPDSGSPLRRAPGTDGSVRVQYMAGWGPQPALVLAIMKKAKSVWINNHDDSITARGTSGDPPQPLEENWTDEEIAQLGRFRRLDIPTGGAP